MIGKSCTTVIALRVRSTSAFTLIEVIISLAIVAVAVISIMGIIAVFLQGEKNVMERSEALTICQALNVYLATPDNTTSPVTQGFDKVYSWMQSGKVPQLYAFVIPVDPSKPNGPYAPTGGIPQMQVSATTDPNYAFINNRIGRLYYITLSLSPNFPIHQGVGRKPIYSPAALPATWYPTGASDNAFYADTSLTLSVRVYAVPAVTTLTSQQLETKNFNDPVLMYDTAVTR